MGNSTFVSLSAATALERSLDLAAHNLANASTAGYKAVHPVFETTVADATGSNNADINFVIDKGVFLDSSQGPLTSTGNPLDIALSGGGWFGFEAGGGQTAYGRYGQLAIDTEGQLVTATGQAILDDGGAPLVVPPETGHDVNIAPDGTVSGVNGQVLGRVGVFDIANENDLVPVGNGLYLGENVQANPAESPQVAQGHIESSNVQPIVEMTRMIDIQRAYERAVKLVNEENELVRQAIQRLGRTT